MNPDLVIHWEWQGNEHRFEIFVTDDFSHLQQVKQVYALVLSKDRLNVLVVKEKNGLRMLPGGTVEEGETWLDTLVREVKEETNRDVDLETVRPLFYQHAYKKNVPGDWEFLRTEIRFSVVVANDRDFISDPDHGKIVEAVWVPIAKLEEYLEWGETTRLIKELLQEENLDK